MKTRSLFALAAAATIALGSCSKNDDSAPVSVLPEDGVIRVTTSVNDLATRGGMYNDNLNNFGLFITPTNTQVPATYTYSNVFMRKNEQGKWKAYENSNLNPLDAPMLWSKASEEVTVIAYQSWNSNATLGEELKTDVWGDQTIDEGKNSDLLWAKNEVKPDSPNTNNDIYYNTTTQSLDIKMNHMLSKLRVNVKYGTALTQNGATTPTLGDVVVSNTQTQFLFNLTTGGVTLNEWNYPYPSIRDIKMSHEPTDNVTTGFDATCEAILVPQTAAFSVKLTVDGKEYTYTYPVPEGSTGYKFEGNTLYTLNLTVGKDIVAPNGLSASEWGNGTGSSLETE